MQQRPADRDSVSSRDSRHTGEAGGTRTAQQPEKDGLGLIVGVMGGQHGGGTLGPGAGGQQRVARVAGAFLQACLGFGALPHEQAVGNAQAGTPAGDHLRLGAGLRPQPVIDRRGNESRPSWRKRGHCPGKMDEGHGIGPAGDGEHEHFGIEEGREARKALIVGGDGRRRSASAQHDRRLASRSAPLRTATDAEGYLRPTSPQVAQACSLAPRRSSARPSLTSASGALADFE